MKAFKLNYLFSLDMDAIERVEVMRSPSSALISQLEASLPEEKSANISVIIDQKQLGRIYAQLSPLLNDDDAEAEAVPAENSPSALGDSYQAIDSAIRDFDFGSAPALLKSTVTKLNLEP